MSSSYTQGGIKHENHPHCPLRLVGCRLAQVTKEQHHTDRPTVDLAIEKGSECPITTGVHTDAMRGDTRLELRFSMARGPPPQELLGISPTCGFLGPTETSSIRTPKETVLGSVGFPISPR